MDGATSSAGKKLSASAPAFVMPPIESSSSNNNHNNDASEENAPAKRKKKPSGPRIESSLVPASVDIETVVKGREATNAKRNQQPRNPQAPKEPKSADPSARAFQDGGGVGSSPALGESKGGRRGKNPRAAPKSSEGAVTKVSERTGSEKAKEEPSRSRRREPPRPASAEASTIEEAKASSTERKPSGKSGNRNERRDDSSAKPAANPRWWSKLKDVDPITLVPLSSLKVPPFEIAVENSDVKHMFDAQNLAVYLLSTGKFVNPINRQPMSREDCVRLDAHLRSIGAADQARCTQMLDLQNVVNVRPYMQAANEEAMLNLRREAGVIASHLFHYPSLREQRDQERQDRRRGTTNRGGGAVTVTDDDEHWQSSFPQMMVEEDFPDMPLIRRPAREDDFPPIGRAAATAAASGEAPPRIPVPRPDAPSLSWATVAETASTRTFTNPIPAAQPTAAPTDRVPLMTLSWRQSAERPKLNLVKGSSSSAAASAVRSEAIFGKARPVDSSYLVDDSGPNLQSDQQLLCPYTPRILRIGKGFGPLWISSIEKRFKELVDAGTSRKVIQLDPMPEPRRRLIQEIAVRYWGLHAIEIDPEPYRFLQLSMTPVSFIPDMSLHRALVTFPTMANEEFSNPGAASNGLLFIGCPMSTTNARVHSLLDALTLRESEYHIVMLDGTRPDERSIFVDVSSSERGRKAFKKLTSALPQSLLGFRCRKVEWWPAGVEWAKYQIKMVNEARESIYAPIREQKKYEERRAREERLAQMVPDGWESDEETKRKKNEAEVEAIRRRLAETDWDEDAEDNEGEDQKQQTSSSDDDDDDDDSSDDE